MRNHSRKHLSVTRTNRAAQHIKLVPSVLRPPIVCQLLLLAIVFLVVTRLNERDVIGVGAIGLGDKIIFNSGSLLNEEFEQVDPDRENTIFKRGKGPAASDNSESNNNEAELYGQYVGMIKQWPIDVVAPGKYLTKLMNVVSTNSRAHFLREHELYYERMDLGSTNRPMLMAYLGLKLTDPKQLEGWCAAVTRPSPLARTQIVRSCNELLRKRDERAPSAYRERGQRLSEELRQLEARPGRFHSAYLAHSNNLNLFMMENFLILCSRLGLDELGEFGVQYKPLF